MASRPTTSGSGSAGSGGSSPSPHSHADALAEWALFSRDPGGYRTPRERAADALTRTEAGAVRVDLATVTAFLNYCRRLVDQDEMTTNYVEGTLSNYLTQWAAALRERDLHKVSLDELQALLAREAWQTAYRKRIVALKAFTSWARTEKPAPKLRRAEDPTIDLQTPPVVAEKSRRTKGYPAAFIERFYSLVPSQVVRDQIRLHLCANGMHDSEIDRLARGKGEVVRVDDPSGIAGVLVFRHKKKGGDHAISVDAASLAAAERLQARGAAMAQSAVQDMLDDIAIAEHGCGGELRVVGKRKTGARAGADDRRIEPCPGCRRLLPSELRHSFATLAKKIGQKVYPKNGGDVSLDEIAAAMGHLNKSTTKGFYLGDHVPMMIKLKVKLRHPADPAV
jgi:integrase